MLLEAFISVPNYKSWSPLLFYIWLYVCFKLLPCSLIVLFKYTKKKFLQKPCSEKYKYRQKYDDI